MGAAAGVAEGSTASVCGNSPEMTFASEPMAFSGSLGKGAALVYVRFEVAQAAKSEQKSSEETKICFI